MFQVRSSQAPRERYCLSSQQNPAGASRFPRRPAPAAIGVDSTTKPIIYSTPSDCVLLTLTASMKEPVTESGFSSSLAFFLIVSLVPPWNDAHALALASKQ